MAGTTDSSSTTATNADQRPRRLSLRKSLSDCGLSPDYLDALETKRRALDESIHKFIASKEREYKQYEKDLRHQARRAENSSHEHHASTTDATGSAADGPQHHSSGIDERTSSRATPEEVSSKHVGQHSGHKRKQEDFPGVFTPEYLAALSDHEQERSASEPAAVKTEIASSIRGLARNNSDSAANTNSTRPARFQLSHPTSSSGSGFDSKLVSAMKSATAETTQLKRKRVSIAVGDSIVAPSDNVPLALHVKSSSSHSRPRTPRRERQAFIDESSVRQDTPHSPSSINGALQALRQQGSASAAVSALETIPVSNSAMQEGDDVGDLFDLEDEDAGDAEADIAQLSDEAGSSQDSLPDVVAGRVSSVSPVRDASPSDSHPHERPGEPPPASDDGDMEDVPLTPIVGAAAATQPIDPGFRRPSATVDPVYRGGSFQQTSREAEEGDVYSSSFSRPTSKGSFTSGSLGESYMARNAEAMMELRAQQRRQEDGHRSSQSHTVLPVR